MALNLQRKKEIISEIKKIVKKSLSAVVADVCSVNANKINELRKVGRENKVYMFITKNTLLNIALTNTKFDCLKKMFFGPTLIAYSLEYAGAAARLFKEFAKNNHTFKIKAAAFEGDFIPAEKIDYLSNQPTYNEAIINIITVIKEAAIGKLIRTLYYVISSKKEN